MTKSTQLRISNKRRTACGLIAFGLHCSMWSVLVRPVYEDVCELTNSLRGIDSVRRSKDEVRQRKST